MYIKAYFNSNTVTNLPEFITTCRLPEYRPLISTLSSSRYLWQQRQLKLSIPEPTAPGPAQHPVQQQQISLLC